MKRGDWERQIFGEGTGWFCGRRTGSGAEHSVGRRVEEGGHLELRWLRVLEVTPCIGSDVMSCMVGESRCVEVYHGVFGKEGDLEHVFRC